MVGEDPQAHPDLWRGEARPGRVQHGVGEILDQPAQLRVEVADRLGRRPQHGITKKTDGVNTHGFILSVRPPRPGRAGPGWRRRPYVRFGWPGPRAAPGPAQGRLPGRS